MKLTDLNPRFVDAGGQGVMNADKTPIPKRHGIGLSFDCPCGCKETRVYVSFENPIDGGEVYEKDRPTWKRTGDNFDNITLTPSIFRSGGCRWHGFLTNGETKTV